MFHFFVYDFCRVMCYKEEFMLIVPFCDRECMLQLLFVRVTFDHLTTCRLRGKGPPARGNNAFPIREQVVLPPSSVMAYPLIWPRRAYYYYPVGNTAPVCLTQDVPPEVSPNILLLGCGDPRNILFTIYSSGLDDVKCKRPFVQRWWSLADIASIKRRGRWTLHAAIMNPQF